MREHLHFPVDLSCVGGKDLRVLIRKNHKQHKKRDRHDRAEKHREYTDEGQTRIAEEIRRRGRSFLDAWERVIDRAKEGGKRIYSRYDRAGEGRSLLFVATDPLPEDHNERHFQAPTSMRDVEPSVHVWPQFIPLDSPKNP